MFVMANSYLNNGYKVFVICPLPNYPQGSIFKDYRNKFFLKEKINGIDIKRLWVFASNSRSKFIRLFSMLSFGICLFVFLLFNKTPKKVIIQCSPLLVGFFAVLASKIKGKTIILNVSDLWPLAGIQMGLFKKGIYFNLLEKIERYNYKSAHLILGQSEEILEHIKLSYPKKNFFLYRNLPDFKPPKVLSKPHSEEIKIVYAGLLGVAQGVFNICKEIKLPSNVTLDIYGDGPEKDCVKNISDKNPQIHFHGLIERDKLHEVLIHYDFALVPLINRIYGSVPSKIFEYTSLGLPIIYFSEGEGADLISKYKLGYTIKDNNYKALNKLILELASGEKNCLIKNRIQEISMGTFNLEVQFKKYLEFSNSL
ncbi:MAG: glycosyltransferase family 4 protein [Flavobacteriaceae bacterium]|nr:glycosyltransferase family 4 protein [Flavobacteriaceae bacterium]